LRRTLGALPARRAYYPGAAERLAEMTAGHADAEALGPPGAAGEPPWTLLAGLDPAGDHACFRSEAFCGLLGETALEAESPLAFLERAVAFANTRLWGNLCATLLIHPSSLGEPGVRAGLAAAVEDLRYGTVTVNLWAAVGFGLSVTPWGAYPGNRATDIQSGSGVVHNTLMLERIEKTVIRGPFRSWPTPVWFASHRHPRALARRLTAYEAEPTPARLPGLLWYGLRGGF
jgi:hypothetical protein